MLPTIDPSVIIEARSPGRVVYRNVEGERWEIIGTCIACGECEEGALEPRIWTGPPGTPGVCLDPTFGTRLDVPVRPEIATKHSSCTLRGRYLP